MTQTTITPNQLNDYSLTSGLARNAIINGNFDVWQRGTSFSVVEYTADRWKLEVIGSSCTTTRQAFTVGQTDVPNNPRYYIRHAVTTSAGASNYAYFDQRIESVRTFAGQTATLSFWAKADASKNIALELLQIFGTGGSPSSAITGIEAQKIALTTSWTKYEITVSIPSISGKTLGTTDDGWLGIYFWMDAGSSFDARTDSLGQQSGTFEFAQVQLCAGEVALPFMPKSYEEELDACMRYYEKSYPYDTDPGTNTLSGTQISFAVSTNALSSLQYFKPKRATPTITIYSKAGTSGKATNTDGTTDIGSGVTGLTITDKNCRLVYDSGGSPFTAGNSYYFHYTADAEL